MSRLPVDPVAPSIRRMPRPVVVYVRVVERLGRAVGALAMVLTFVLAAILLEASVARLAFGTSHIWSVELAQFTMSAYYLLGGALSEQDAVHVRMDLFYSRLSPRAKLVMDCLTTPLVLVYLTFLFYGGIRSSLWAIENNQVNYTPWAPPMAPIKLIMTAGIKFFSSVALKLILLIKNFVSIMLFILQIVM